MDPGNDDILGQLLSQSKEELTDVSTFETPTEPVRFTGAQLAQLRAQIYVYRAWYKKLAIPEGQLVMALNRGEICKKSSLSFTFDERPEWSVVSENPPLSEQLSKIEASSNQIAPSQKPAPIDPIQILLERNIRIRLKMDMHMKEIEMYQHLIEDKESKLKTEITLRALKLAGVQRHLRREVQAIYKERKKEQTNDKDKTSLVGLPKQKQRQIRQKRQQKLEAERKKKQKHAEYLASVLSHVKEFKEFHKGVHSQTAKMTKAVLTWHLNNEKEARRLQEKLEKERMQRLMLDDEAAYRQMIDEKKDRRLAFLLRQTDEFISNLVTLVKQHKEDKAAERIESEKEMVHVRNQMTGERDSVAENELEGWLESHPGFEVAPRDEDDDQKGLASLVPASDEQARLIIEKAKTEEDDDYQRNSNENASNYYAIAHSIVEPVKQQPSIMINGELKQYQLQGIEWLVSLYNNSLNGILADEMGLGKTIQTIGLVAYLAEKKKTAGPHIIVVPLATISNWQFEFEKWVPSLKVIVYKGSPQHRKNLAGQIKSSKFNVLLTTYEYIIKDKAVLSKLKWKYLIIDEGHRMKNHHCKLTVVLNTYYTAPHRLLLTGTPLQNNLPELWALLNFMLPNIFKSCTTFEQWFNAPFANTTEKVELNSEESLLIIRRLHKVLRPFLLRRLKKTVESQLPEKVEYVLRVEMSGLQRVVYKHMQKGILLTGTEKDKGGGARSLMNTLMQLRKICNHPFMFAHIEQAYAKHIGLPENFHITGPDLFRVAGKFELLDRILPKLKATGHRVLLFSQMTSALTILEDYFQLKQYKYLRLDGSTKADDRGELLRQFQAPGSDYFIFLLSTRAGGLGLNLQTADTVIIFDSDWNPHQDLQAQDRAHRIGQKNEVRVFRLVTVNSVEERILAAARYKLSVDEKVIQAGKFDQQSTSNERRRFLQVLLQQDDIEEEEDSEVPDDKAINEMLSRTDEETEIFEKMDEERASYDRACGLRNRLIQECELPSFLLRDEEEIQKMNEEKEFEEMYYGRGARERKQIDYGQDSMTEDQWLRDVLDEETGRRRKKGSGGGGRKSKKPKIEASSSGTLQNHDSTVAMDAFPEDTSSQQYYDSEDSQSQSNEASNSNQQQFGYY